MRNAIQEYLNYTNEEKKELWNHATFVFDTNVYLNLYRYTGKTREQLLSALSELKDRLWMPNHVAREFMKNRIGIIWETNNQYSVLRTEADKYIELCRSSLKLDQNNQGLAELKAQMKAWIDTSMRDNVAVTNPDSDAILNQLLLLYEGKVGLAYSKEEMESIEQEGRQRYEKSVPPGYKDYNKQKGDNLNNVYGDFVVWKQILKYASSEKKDIILVTNDQKEDWWEILHGQTHGPRIELRKEFFTETSQKFHMYSMSNFISRFESENGNIDRGAIDEIEFFSIVIHHKSSKSDLRQYYDSFGNDDEAKAARIRFKIARLENKNRKRENSIQYNRDKYVLDSMPEEIEKMVDSTVANYVRDSLQIEKLKAALQALYAN